MGKLHNNLTKMDNIIKQLKSGAKHTKLSFSEKAEIRHALLAHVKQNPHTKSIFENYLIRSPFSMQNLRSKKITAGLVIGGLLLSGSVSFAAENALPGDVLFPIKTNVNEKVRGFAAVTPKAKAEWDVRLVERRIEEVEKISKDTSASLEKIALAEDYFDTYSKKVNERIEKLEKNKNKEDAILTAEQFSQMLLNHEDFSRSTKNNNDKKLNKNREERSTFNKEGLVSTTTVNAEDDMVDDDDSFKNVLRETRGEVEKKHKEMREKHDNEKNALSDQDIKSIIRDELRGNQSVRGQLEMRGPLQDEVRSKRERDQEKRNEN